MGSRIVASSESVASTCAGARKTVTASSNSCSLGDSSWISGKVVSAWAAELSLQTESAACKGNVEDVVSLDGVNLY